MIETSPKGRIHMADSASHRNDTERRRSARFLFSADAEILHRASGKQLQGLVTHLSLNGCHVKVADFFPQGAAIHVKIFKFGEYFETEARVAFLNPGSGLGLSFRNIHPGHFPVLQKWLLEAMRREREKQSP